MSLEPEAGAFAALARFFQARARVPAVAVFGRGADGTYQLRYRTEAFAGLRRGVATGDLPGNIPDGPCRIEPALLGLTASSCWAQPVGTSGQGEAAAGFVAIACSRPRRMDSQLTQALEDAALLARPLIEKSAGGSARRAVEKDRQRTAAAEAAPVATGSEPDLPMAVPRPLAHQLVAAQLRQRGHGEALALLVLDIDRFRAVNEALGAEAGDGILAATASRIGACLGAGDRLIRLESDRFLVVAAPGRRPVRGIAAAMLDAVAAPLDVAARRLVLHASVGVVLASECDVTAARLLMQADGALRRAKAAGGSRIEVHEPTLHAALLDRARMEIDLRHALDNGEMTLVYQPYVNLENGEVDGAEALMRWRHPVRGDIAPATFIPLAEATGQIHKIGMWALRSACAAAAHWEGSLRLSVNVSSLQFHDKDFVAHVDAVLAETGFPAGRLELEITESVLMRDNPETTALLRTLIGRGIRIALDDFGTGYSALAYLSRLPHHRIKLDKSFVQDLGRPSTAGLIRAIIALARTGKISITAEGVEGPEQLRAVKAMGFTHAQGFATGAPVGECGLRGREARSGVAEAMRLTVS